MTIAELREVLSGVDKYALTRRFFDLQMKRIHTWKREPTQEEMDSQWAASGLSRGQHLDATVDFLKALDSMLEAALARTPTRVGERPMDALKRGFAEGRLHQFERMKKERPIDPVYWDSHEERDLRAALRGQS